MSVDLNLFLSVRRIVFKVGSALLVDSRGRVSNQKINRIVNLFHTLRKEKKELILVSSGAMASANFDLHKPRENYSLVEKQALASIGQVKLMERYGKLFEKKKISIAQILISKFSINHRPSYINTQNTIEKLIQMGVLPIINENDPLATEEIRFGENDVLGALTSALVGSDLYVILSNVDGFYLYRGQKREEKLTTIDRLEAFHWKAAKKGKSSVGQGGMVTKLEAAQIAGSFKIPTLITNGEAKDLYRSIFRERSGTLFFDNDDKKTKLSKSSISTHKKWLLSHVTPKGEIIIDSGAAKAIQNGKSLLPKGIVKVKGHFISGDVCNLITLEKEIIARGMSYYSSQDLSKIKKKKLSELESILGHSSGKEAVHRNHLVIL